MPVRQPSVAPFPISLDDGDTESIFSAVCETCNQPENSGSLQHFSCCNSLAHRAGVDDGVDAICPFCRMDLRELLEGGPAVQCPLWRGPVDPQECGPEAVNVFPCCPRTLFHLRCLATSIPGASDGSEVCCPVCPEGVRSYVDVEWLEKQCHINGVEFPSQVDCGACTVCTEEMTIDSSISLPCCHRRLHVTCLARSLSSRPVDCPFCNQSLAKFARSASFLASSVFHGCVVDVDVPPTNRGINSSILDPGFPRPPEDLALLCYPRSGPTKFRRIQ